MCLLKSQGIKAHLDLTHHIFSTYLFAITYVRKEWHTVSPISIKLGIANLN